MVITAKLKDRVYCLSLSLFSLFGYIGVLYPAQAACTFSNTTPGQLVKSSSGLKALEASAGLLGGLDGLTGQVRLDCTNGGLLSIDQPKRVSAPASFTPTISHALVQLDNTTMHTFASNGGGQFAHVPWAGRSTSPITVPIGIHTLTIGMIVGENNSSFIPSGIYSYTTTLNVVPN